MMESLMCVCASPGASSGGPGNEMSSSEATLGGLRRESPPPSVALGEPEATPFCRDDKVNGWWELIASGPLSLEIKLQKKKYTFVYLKKIVV